MRQRVFVLATTVVAAVAIGSSAQTAAAAPAACDPIQTPPVFAGVVPTSKQVLGFPLGSQEVTAAETNAYVDAVDAASDRVVSGTFGTTPQGRELRYALVGDPDNVSPGGLAAVQDAMRTLRDPETPAREAERLARTTPVVLWLMDNVHGGEESGTDAALRVLYELADRTDCAATQILDNAVVGFIPTQNPDGREAETRQNSYGFDMNRDWFARTQAETDTKLELLRRYPGQLFIDGHEMGGNHYFFPPTADPTYHEITSQSMYWQDVLYGGALAAEFKRQHIQFFTDKVFDFFAMVYGDTVPATSFGAAGMTFEKANFDPIAQRTYEHYVTHWVSISQGALNREDILNDWHAGWAEAFRQGLSGELEPNEVNDRGNTVQLLVPNEKVRHYFLRADDPTKAAEVQMLVRRLQRMDVQVYRLTAPLAVPDFKAYGRPAGGAVFPAGTYWIPMAQMQKHWIQSMLNENTYVPFPYFYDVSGWSNPLLLNLSGGRSGAVLFPAAELVGPLAAPAQPPLPAQPPRVAVYQLSSGTSGFESTGWLRYLLEQEWHLPYQRVTAAQIASGALSGFDVLLAPNGVSTTASNALGPTGRKAVLDWVNAGGEYVGWRGGADLAARLGLTTARIAEPHSDVAGALIRVAVDSASPLAAGVGPFNWVFYDYDLVMTASSPTHVAARFPAYGSEDFFVSGFARGESELGGTAAVVDEPVGAGRVVVFSTDPNYRAWSVGMQKMLRNAVLGPDAFAGAAARAGSRTRAGAERAAKDAAAEVVELESPLRLSVDPGSVDAARAVLARHGASYTLRTTGNKATFLIANPGGLSGDEHPYAAALPGELLAAGVRVIAYRVP
ncbi:MAG TPA: M14 family zinc carboxypeptidase [Gaiellaceae bacterium]|nr:M14 family zinc carboxypeptidase [Gaiellaceae bacterium]